MPKDVVDSAAVQEALLRETPAFTKAQRMIMSATVASHMSATPVSAGGNNKMQANLYLYNYLTEGAWFLIFSKDYTYDQKLEYLADFLLAIGCRNASDDTIKLAIAIVNTGCERTMTPNEAYMHLNIFKTKMEEKRKLKPGARTAQQFPSDPSDFQRLYPSIYLECEPPVGSRIDEMKLRQMTRKDMMPSRSSNKMLSGSPTSNHGPASSSGSASNAVASNILEYVLGNCQNGSAISQLLSLANGDRNGGPPVHILEPRSKRNRTDALPALMPPSRDPSMSALAVPLPALAIENQQPNPSEPAQALPAQAAAPLQIVPAEQPQILALPAAAVPLPPNPPTSALDAVVAQARICLTENAKISAVKSKALAKAKAKAAYDKALVAAVAAAIPSAVGVPTVAAAAIMPVESQPAVKPVFRVKAKTAIANLKKRPAAAIIPKTLGSNLDPIEIDEFPEDFAAEYLSAASASAAKTKGSFTSRAYDHCKKHIDHALAKRAYQYAAHMWNSTRDNA